MLNSRLPFAGLCYIVLTNMAWGQIAAVDFTTQVNAIFTNAGCSSTDCHGGNTLPIAFGPDPTQNFNAIVNVTSNCNNLSYVNPGDPNTSHLYLKMAGTQACGSRMPRTNPTYFDSHTDELTAMRVWIEEGALFQPVSVDLADGNLQIPVEFSLAQNFPNPFNPSTSITYNLPRSSRVRLTVYDLTGREMRILQAGYQQAGSYTVTWYGDDRFGRPAGSGVYFYQLTAGTFRAINKMILLQ